MEAVLQAIVSIIVLGVLIFVHELGHFLLAKWNGVGVLDFSIGFGRSLWSKKWGETTYSIRLIPLGGFVRMVGDDIRQVSAELSEQPIDELSEELDEETKALMADRERWFLTKGFFAKAAIVIAGPAFNLIFAVFVSMASFYFFGKVVPVSTATIGDVIPNYPAAKAGLQAGDRVVSIDGQPMSVWEDIANTVSASGGKEMSFLIERKVGGGSEADVYDQLTITLAGTNETSELDVIEGRPKSDSVKVGILRSVTRESISFTDALYYGTYHTYRLVELTLRGLWGMIAGKISAKNIAGPIVILTEAAKSAKKGIEYVLDFMVFLSVSLAVLNLLPIPILDGGHLMFFIIEALKGSPVSLRVHELANQVGMLLLLLLMAFAVSNDVIRVVSS